MKKINQNQGFSLVELVLVIVLLGIIGVPITESIISSMQTNVRSKQVMDATVLSGQLAEQIVVGGPELAGFIFDPNPPTLVDAQSKILDKVVNGSNYSVVCTYKGTVNASTVIAGYKKYYLMEVQPSIIYLHYYDNGSEVLADRQQLSCSSNNLSLVFNDGKLSVYTPITKTVNGITWGENNLGTLQGDFTKKNGLSITDLRVVESDILGNPINSNNIKLNLYNNMTNNVVNVLYNSNLNENYPDKLHINYSNNNSKIILVDIKNITDAGLSNNATISNQVNYVITIKKNASDVDALVTREVTRVVKQ